MQSFESHAFFSDLHSEVLTLTGRAREATGSDVSHILRTDGIWMSVRYPLLPKRPCVRWEETTGAGQNT